jgi:hypothetical protein
MAKKAEIKRYPLNMRTTKGVRERLERAAAKSGRSLAQEVEWRLERSLDFDGHLVLARGDIWSSILVHNGELWVILGDDPRDFPVPPGAPPHEEHMVVLKISPENLKRFLNYFKGAPFPYEYSNEEIEAAGDQWAQMQLDIKRGK